MKTSKTRKPLTRPEIYKVVNDYIGVTPEGYLHGFSYASHKEFYPYHCGLEIDPLKLPGSTRARFISILEDASPEDQAKILRGVLAKIPVSDAHRPQVYGDIQAMIARLQGNSAVARPTPTITSAVVERAINDAETLIQTSGATSGVDRIHTALHGYLLAVCDEAGIEYTSEPSLTDLLKLLKEHHPALDTGGPRSQDMVLILRQLTSIISVLSPVRNKASVAHPNPTLLAADEAMLVINAARTVLHYLDAKFSPPVRGGRP